MFSPEFLFDRLIDRRVIKHSLIRRSRNLFILPHILGSHTYFLNLSTYRFEVVLIQIGNLPELIHERNNVRQSNRRYPKYFRTTCPFRSSTYILSFDFPGSERDMVIPSVSHHPFTCQLMNSLPVSGWAESHLHGRAYRSSPCSLPSLPVLCSIALECSSSMRRHR